MKIDSFFTYAAFTIGWGFAMLSSWGAFMYAANAFSNGRPAYAALALGIASLGWLFLAAIVIPVINHKDSEK